MKETTKERDLYRPSTYFIEMSYLGSNYHGWQKQKNISSIQEILENALSTIFNRKVEVIGSSRTDAGVHALQQFAHFSLCHIPAEETLDEDIIENKCLSDDKNHKESYELPNKNLNEELLQEYTQNKKGINNINIPRTIHQLNCLLPKDIAIKNIYKVREGAHSRFDAISRTYQYWIIGEKNPILIDRALYLNVYLDIEMLNKTCMILQNHYNFKSFTKTKTQVNNYNCNIEYARWYNLSDIRNGATHHKALHPGMLVFEIKSNRFLRSMVRNIVGTMIQVGSHKLSLDKFEQIISSRDVRMSGKCISPNGLYLIEVGYPVDFFS